MQQRAAEQGAVNDSGEPEYSIRVGGQERTYLLHVPAGYDGRTALPLVIVFHGGGATAAGAARMSGMSPKADREKFLVAYPNGTGPQGTRFLTWNAWTCCGAALERQVDDVGFVRALIEKLEQERNVDPKRIYATGLSNGGLLTYRVGCALADLLAAIAPVAGALDTDSCRPVSPLSAIIFHGTADQHVLYDGGAPVESFDRTHHRIDKPVSYAVGFWTKHDRCVPIPTRTRKGHVIHDVYAGCADGTAVELYSIEGQGHAWPGGQNGLRYGNVDAPTQEISATDLMWDFFARHPRR
jgi:polyhydroxybutyrate depolymerase